MDVADDDDAAGTELLGGEGGMDDAGQRVACRSPRIQVSSKTDSSAAQLPSYQPT